ncbi:hypothetical protein LINPERPRIM_LOCUS33673 [Linum perenne]
MTRVASGTSYVTINLFLKEVTKLFYHIKKMKRDEETVISTMASSMEEKVEKYWFEKYWSEDVANVKVNRLVYIGAILDPRKKMEIIPYCLSSINSSLSSIYHLYSYRVLFCLGFEETVLKFDATPPAIGSDPLVQPILQSFINKNGNDNDNAIVDSDDDDNEYNEDDALENEMFGMAGASDDD